MFHCPFKLKCEKDFFGMENGVSKSMTFLIEHEFCQLNFQQCARFAVMESLGAGVVPNSMFPTQIREASCMILESADVLKKAKKTA